MEQSIFEQGVARVDIVDRVTFISAWTWKRREELTM